MTGFRVYRLITAIAAAAIVALAATAAPASASAAKPGVQCDAGDHFALRVRPDACKLVVSFQNCSGGCRSDQIRLSHCHWRGWSHQRARGHCTTIIEASHRRVRVKFRRPRFQGHAGAPGGIFTRARIGGHRFKLPVQT